MTEGSSARLKERILSVCSLDGATACGVSVRDYESGIQWHCNGDRWFHAASTIKLAVLLVLFDALEEGGFSLDSRLHVRNRFLSIVDRTPFRIDPARDPNSRVHSYIGRTMRIEELATHMITTSSNLATNLILDFIGLKDAQRRLQNLGLEGIQLRRGVEDDKAFSAGIINRVTAQGLVQLFSVLQERRSLSADGCHRLFQILFDQEFNSGIPAGLPESSRAGARVAHKTGEISTVTHDAGLVFLPGRQPYALAVLTESSPDRTVRQETIAKISAAVYDFLFPSIEQEQSR